MWGVCEGDGGGLDPVEVCMPIELARQWANHTTMVH